MSKHSRQGGKYTGNHTTLVPLAALMCDIADASPYVTKISPGFIKAGLRSAGGNRRVKIIDSPTYILLSIRDNSSQQEVHIYTSDSSEAKKALTQGAKDLGVTVTFPKNTV